MQLQHILDADVSDVATYLHANMTDRVAPDRWAAAMNAPWQHDPPNHGVYLRAGGAVVGAYLALYSERRIRGEAVKICNLAAWCVDPEYRFSSVRMLKALLAQDGYSFTDLSPSGSVIALNERLGFRRLDTATDLVANLPWPTWPRRSSITADPAAIEAALSGDALQIYLDHASAPAVRHLLLASPAGQSHVMFRRDRRKGLPLFGTIVYASDGNVVRAMRNSLCRRLLVRYGIPALLVERRVVGGSISPSFALDTPRPKMFKSDRLGAEDIDNLYSELIAVAW